VIFRIQLLLVPLSIFHPFMKWLTYCSLVNRTAVWCWGDLGDRDMQGTLPDHLKNLAPLYKKGRAYSPRRVCPLSLTTRPCRSTPISGFSGVWFRQVLRHEGDPGGTDGKKNPHPDLRSHYEMSFNTPFEGMDEGIAKKYASNTEVLTVGGRLVSTLRT